VHANESIFVYRSTENQKLGVTGTWTADTLESAQYMLAVIHFCRYYALMDFGRNREGRTTSTGRPPSPMWFSAYGLYAFRDVPVLYQGSSWTWPVDGDFVGVPNPRVVGSGSQEPLLTGKEKTAAMTESFGDAGSGLVVARGGVPRGSDQMAQFTWLPIKIEISINLVVQHSIAYWTDRFSLDAFKSGAMAGIRG
jgi:hypothetical protein